MPRFQPRLYQLFLAMVFGLTLCLGVLFVLLLSGSKDAILETSRRLRETSSRQIGDHVSRFLAGAESPVLEFQRRVAAGVIDPAAEPSLESALYGMLLDNLDLAEVTLTLGRMTGEASDGRAIVAPAGRGQWSLYRDRQSGGERIVTRHVTGAPGQPFRCTRRGRPPGGGLTGGPLTSEPDIVPDPTEDATFVTPARKGFRGRSLWSDLSWFKPDMALPADQRRVVVTVQRAVVDGAGTLVGVLRVGIFTSQLDSITHFGVDPARNDHRVLLCDPAGRLVVRLSPEDRLELQADDLRYAPASPPPEVAAALALFARERPAMAGRPWSTRMATPGGDHLVTFQPLSGTQDWIVGIVVPEAAYLGDLVETRRRLLQASLLVMLAIVLGGVLSLRLLQRDLGEIVSKVRRIRELDFSPLSARPRLQEVTVVLDGIEQAKVALRAMGKYVPMGLVRELYRLRQEPAPGGVQQPLTLMFTDIKDFTSLSETTPPDELARQLGLYLAAIARRVHEHEGIIDKYIGDAVMALWNAPLPVADHALKACRTALASQRALADLFEAPEWEGKPPLATRYGIHTGQVLVGHFGAPDRLNYTALGDGVNLASRLEGLNKAYGTSILVSGAVYEEARAALEFRLLDLVAVKGKSRSVKVYELLGERPVDPVRLAAARSYEHAFSSYLQRDFAHALELFERIVGDPAAAVLAGRCRELIAHPPGDDWDGTHMSRSK